MKPLQTSVFFILFHAILLSGCNRVMEQNPEENPGISDKSIFNLTTRWNTQDSTSVQLKDLKGKVLVIVMIYTSCKVACPRLVADMKNIEAQMPVDRINGINFVLVSIDPETDTPSENGYGKVESLFLHPFRYLWKTVTRGGNLSC